MLDRRSRRKTIYALDFFAAAFYLTAALLVVCKLISFPLLLALAFAGSLAGVGAYAQRNSGMQSYVPNAVRARFNSAASVTASLGAGWRRITTVFVNTGDA